MLEWKIAERSSDTLFGHLAETRQHLDNIDYSDCKTEDFFGFQIPDKKLMADLIKAAARIIKAVKNNEKIVIFGHDDVDGITATYLLFDFLSKIGSYSHYYYIPNRITDQHGIKETFVETANRNKYSLVVTVDGGITSAEGIDQLNSIGCDVIITDHHLIPASLPAAFAIVNPKREDCPYPDKMLAGVGIVYFLLATIAELLSVTMPDKYLFWTAVGTIADKAPMVGVNRVITKIVYDDWGRFIQRPVSLWSNYISQESNNYFEKSAYISNLIKFLSSGRDSQGENLALYFLLSPDYMQREVVAKLITRKQQYESEVLMVRKIIEYCSANDDLFYFYYDEEDKIPYTLMGFAGSYLSNRYKIPIVILKNKDGLIAGEGKCTDSFDMVAALDYCRSSLLQYGGHKRAAGFSLAKDKLEDFRNLFKEYAYSVKEQIDCGKIIKIDAEVKPEEIESLQDIVSLFSPFGEDAPMPVFLVKNIVLAEVFPTASVYTEKESLFSDEGKRMDVVFTFRSDGKVVIIDTGDVKRET